MAKRNTRELRFAVEPSIRDYSKINAIEDDEDIIVEPKGPSWCCKPTCGIQRLPRWATISVGILLTVGILLIITFFLIMPLLVQNIVSNSELSFDSVQISDPTETSFKLTVAGSIKNAGPVSSEIVGAEIAILYNDNTLGSIQMPSISAGGSSSNSFSFSAPCKVSDISTYEKYISALVNAKAGEEVKWTLQGKPTVKAMGLSFTVKFDKTVGIPGMGGLSNITVLSFDMPENSPEGGVKLLLNVTQYNPSKVSMALGSITLDMMYAGSFLGRVSGRNITLNAGTNFMSLEGYVKPENLTTASVFMSNYLTGVDSVVNIQGLNAGNSSVGWLQYIVKLLNINSTFPGAKNLSLMHNLQLTTLSMNFLLNGSIYAGSSIQSGFTTPFAFPLQIEEVALNFDLLHNGVSYAHIDTPFNPATSSNAQGLVWTSFANISAQVLNEDLFATLINDVLIYLSATTSIKGTSNIVVSTAMGNLTLANIQYQQHITITGMNSFADPLITVNKQVILGATRDAIKLGLTLQVDNPSAVELIAPTLPILGSFNKTLLSNNTIAPVYVAPSAVSECYSTSYLVKDGTSDSYINWFLSQNIMGNQVILDLQGDPDATPIYVMKKALSNFRSKVIVPGIQVSLIAYAELTLSWEMFRGILPTKLTLFNPWPIPLQIVRVKQNIYLSDTGRKIANLNEDLTSDPITIPARQTVVTKPLPIKVDGISIEELEAFVERIELSVSGQMRGIIDQGFVVDMQYSQANIPASFLKE